MITIKTNSPKARLATIGILSVIITLTGTSLAFADTSASPHTSKMTQVSMTDATQLDAARLTTKAHPMIEDTVDTGIALTAVASSTANTAALTSSIVKMSDDAKLELPGMIEDLQAPENHDWDAYPVHREDGKSWTIRVHNLPEEKAASISVDNQVVIKFRSGIDNLDAYDRAHIVAQRLYNYLNDIDDAKKISITPAVSNHLPIIKIGDDVLTSVDRDTASAAQQSPARLALAWSNQVRTAIGMDALPTGNETSILDTPASELLEPTNTMQQGAASWYGPGFHGRRAADGSRFDMNKMTAAHRFLPFGTTVKVTNKRNGRSCFVQITDRGPYSGGRIIDLSKAAAGAIGMLSSGTAKVTLQVMSPRHESNSDVSKKSAPQT